MGARPGGLSVCGAKGSIGQRPIVPEAGNDSTSSSQDNNENDDSINPSQDNNNENK